MEGLNPAFTRIGDLEGERASWLLDGNGVCSERVKTYSYSEHQGVHHEHEGPGGLSLEILGRNEGTVVESHRAMFLNESSTHHPEASSRRKELEIPHLDVHLLSEDLVFFLIPVEVVFLVIVFENGETAFYDPLEGFMKFFLSVFRFNPASICPLVSNISKGRPIWAFIFKLINEAWS